MSIYVYKFDFELQVMNRINKKNEEISGLTHDIPGVIVSTDREQRSVSGGSREDKRVSTQTEDK